MSNLVFPVLRGLEWDVEKDIITNTTVQRSKSGRRVAVSEQQIPLWKWTMSVSVLDRSKLQVGQIYDDFARLAGFYMQLLGAYDSFLYEDPTDCQLTAENIGTGDGITTGYQVTRNLGGYKEAITEIQPSPALQVFVNDWEGNQLQYPTPRTNLMLRSQELDNAGAWFQGGTGGAGAVVITANATAAPDGTTTAEKLDFPITTAGQTARIVNHPAPSPILGVTFTYSFWMRADVPTTVRLHLEEGASPFTLLSRVSFNVTTTWQEFTITGTMPGSSSATFLNCYIDNGGGVQSAKTIYAWGGMCEVGPVGTSYIPTTSAPVTVTDYSINSTGLITFAVAPLTAAAITVTGKYYFRCAFCDDDMSATSGGSGMLALNNFINNFWEAKTIVIESLKP